jgi:hypothetical protein
LKGFALSQCVKERHSFERHPQKWDHRRSATPFYQKEQCGNGTHIFEKSKNMRGPLFSLFFSDFLFVSVIFFFLFETL